MITTVNPEVQKTVEEHFSRISGVTGALVVAADGLPLSAYELAEDRVEHWSAIAATLMGVARRAVDQAEGGAVRRLVVAMDEGHVVLAEAGGDAVLLVIISAGADLAAAEPELALLAGRLREVLGAAADEPS